MKKIFLAAISTFLIFNSKIMAQNYINNRAPLIEKPYIELPLGSIKAMGWLHEMLLSQKNGSTGQLDKLYPSVMGKRNGWLGGDGDQWERGPYWIDGLLPLAYILDDKDLIKKVKPWVEWTINSQQPSGYFGPDKDYPNEPGLQRDNSHDWWPKMVMLKVLQQYYSVTNDIRVINLMSKYFEYQLNTLPEKPLGNWSFWAEYRSGDNLQAVYWLYNITGEKFLLDLGDLLHDQGYDYVNMFLKRKDLSRINTIHGVNLAQGIKEPIIYYQQAADPKYLESVKKAFADIKRYNGQPQGMYGADEALHGNNPTQGSELCSAVELMFSLEKMIEITGDVQYMEHLERIAFNALPSQISDDFMTRQYFQQANQVKISRHIHNFDENHNETDLLFGLLTGYPCCTANMHQGWPKFTQNLWYSTNDDGIAALVYSPSVVSVKVGNGVSVKITEDTNYPFEERIRFIIEMDKKDNNTVFPFHLRIPSWSDQASILVNGMSWEGNVQSNSIAIINRNWKSGDIVELSLPMKVETSIWYENSMVIERGPLVYALKVDEEWQKKSIEDYPSQFGETYYAVHPKSPWNYGIVALPKDKDKRENSYIVITKTIDIKNPWSPENAPIEIKLKGKQIPYWKLYNEMAGPQPYSKLWGTSLKSDLLEEEITLIPFGSTTLRISEFPIVSGD